MVESKSQSKPNVILILTDDQGIGDLGCHGNPWLKTPNIDTFYEESVRLTDFHVSPLCTPTRAAIMTGKYPINNGAWATFKGRDALSKNTPTIANLFQENGYTTALFGKWHLGDNYPVRPTDSGFNFAIHHLAGGIGELSDYWGNSYFDDVYYVNNEAKQFQGYCTDVWFEESMKFIEKQEDNPFFIYLALNAPHDPLIVDEKYAAPYKHLEGSEIISANLYGMIANIDENFGKLRQFLAEKKLTDNTIFIFMSDNGTRFGYSKDGKLGYNKGFRGIKGSKAEGGHRVPFFIQWKDGKIQGGKDQDFLSAHVDLLPTLASLCGIDLSDKYQTDGVDLSPILRDKKENLDERSIFIHHRQDWRPPHDLAQSCVLQNQWRLINGKELYDTSKDPLQKNNIVKEHRELVNDLLSQNASFIESSKKHTVYNELSTAIIGNKAQKEVKLTIQHAIGEDVGIWKCEQVAKGVKNKNNTHSLEIEKEGYYLISCSRWPKELAAPILGSPTNNLNPHYSYKNIHPEKVRIRIANQIIEKEILENQYAVSFRVYLEKGKTLFSNDFIEDGETYGVYYTYISYDDAEI
ncbi:arylsulfatase A-like enzyme [Sediminitomix flava]|uniref:Arylsulfatase A-like enzyme n=2 Tax=Sediminitomix flava TaxID=379075 RepID=A0A315Z4C9_SEDFL|nr:arylsulfatase A-like enzyme [Sediminitomix flava]